MKQIILTFLFLYGTAYAASDLILKENQVKHIPNSMLKFEEGEYYLKLNKLKLNQGSTLVIPDYLAGKVLNVQVKELVSIGSNMIIQPFNNNFKRPMENQVYNIWKDHPRATDGANGPDHGGAAAVTEHGVQGHGGGDGKMGRSSVHLKMNVGVRRLDDLSIILKSESGGHGGRGGKGQTGGNAACSYGDGGGNGGKGGAGGRGASPGNVKDIEIVWYELSPVLTTNNDIPLGLAILQIPGVSGGAGAPGAGGNGGPGKSCFPLFRRSGGNGGAPGDLGKFPRNDIDAFLGAVGRVSIKKVLK